MRIERNELFFLLREYLRNFLPRQKCVSDHTLKSYRESLNLFITYLAEQEKCSLYQITFDHITADSVERFLSWLKEERNCEATTMNQRLSVIRAFLKYCGSRRADIHALYLTLQSVPFRKKQKGLSIRHFSENALEAILKQPDPQKKKQHRDLFFMILLYDTGARDSEILGLHPADIVLNANAPYVILMGKGKKERTVPIMEKTKQHFLSYIKRFGLQESDSSTPLFYTEIHGERCQMSDDNAARIVDKYASLAKTTCDDVPKKVTPHMFRHSRAIHLYRKGVPLPLISEWLGHSNLEATLIYAYADTEMKREALDKAMQSNHPLYKQKLLSPKQSDDDSVRKACGLK